VKYAADLPQLRFVAVTLNDEQLATLRKNDLHIMYIEEDQLMHFGETGQQCSFENTPCWHLARISDGATIDPEQMYHYDLFGSGVTSYIIDTGIRITHNEFAGGRAVFGANFVGGDDSDCNGHGTHVAGTVGGTTYGVAKSVTLVAVKVLNCAGSGTNAGVMEGILWSQQNCVRKSKCNINMSLGGGRSQTMNDLVDSVVESGMPVVVAAGNSNADACNTSPASAPKAYTVGSTALDGSGGNENQNDVRSPFSNWGRCVDIFGPGSAVLSCWHSSNSAINTISGTSMASPHVCGVVSLIQETGDLNPGVIESTLKNTATPNVITMNCATNCVSTTPNLMLHSTC